LAALLLRRRRSLFREHRRQPTIDTGAAKL
jgi:hypothetical protein